MTKEAVFNFSRKLDVTENRERWRPVVGFEGYYEVSDKGRVRGVDRIVPKKDGTFQFVKGKELKQKDTRDGYKEVALQKNTVAKYIRTHRVVATAFLGIPAPGLEVNHKDGNKHNNNAKNLEWVTGSENQKHAYRMGLQKVSGNAISGRKWIVCITLQHIEHGFAQMQRWLCEQGYTKTTRLNRLSFLASRSNTFYYLGLLFSTDIKEIEKCKAQ